MTHSNNGNKRLYQFLSQFEKPRQNLKLWATALVCLFSLSRQAGSGHQNRFIKGRRCQLWLEQFYAKTGSREAELIGLLKAYFNTCWGIQEYGEPDKTLPIPTDVGSPEAG